MRLKGNKTSQKCFRFFLLPRWDPGRSMGVFSSSSSQNCSQQGTGPSDTSYFNMNILPSCWQGTGQFKDESDKLFSELLLLYDGDLVWVIFRSKKTCYNIMSLTQLFQLPTSILQCIVKVQPDLEPNRTNLNKLKQVGFGVDFVFQCLKNNNNKKKNLT